MVSSIIELLPIVNNNDSRDTKLANDRLPGEVSDVFLHDSRQSFILHPFSEIVDGYDQESHLCFPPGEWPHYVDSLLPEGPQPDYRGQFFCRPPGDVGEPFAFITPLGEEGGVFLHGGPIVPGSDCLMDHRFTP